eukprot:382810-Ditylum_brightwellii.AAC.1
MNEHDYIVDQSNSSNNTLFSKPISKVFYEKLDASATAPTQGTPGSTGYDITAIEGAIIPPYKNQLISTGITVELPNNTYGQIVPTAA